MKAAIDSKTIKQKETVKTIIFLSIGIVYVVYNLGLIFGKAMHQLAIN